MYLLRVNRIKDKVLKIKTKCFLTPIYLPYYLMLSNSSLQLVTDNKKTTACETNKNKNEITESSEVNFISVATNVVGTTANAVFRRFVVWVGEGRYQLRLHPS